MALLQNRWSTLTTAQQTRWNTAATQIETTNALGLSSPISGFEYYIKTNKVAFPGSFSVVDEPNTLTPSDIVNTPAAILSVSAFVRATAINSEFPNFMKIQVYGWPFWVDHATKSFPRVVFLKELSSDLTILTIDFRPEWEDHFGPVVEDQHVAIGIKARISASPFNPMAILQKTVVA